MNDKEKTAAYYRGEREKAKAEKARIRDSAVEEVHARRKKRGSKKQ